jgi:hypothetical protein
MYSIVEYVKSFTVTTIFKVLRIKEGVRKAQFYFQKKGPSFRFTSRRSFFVSFYFQKNFFVLFYFQKKYFHFIYNMQRSESSCFPQRKGSHLLAYIDNSSSMTTSVKCIKRHALSESKFASTSSRSLHHYRNLSAACRIFWHCRLHPSLSRRAPLHSCRDH